MLFSRELSKAGGIKGSTTIETRADDAKNREARLSGRGRWAEKCRTELRVNWAIARAISGMLVE